MVKSCRWWILWPLFMHDGDDHRTGTDCSWWFEWKQFVYCLAVDEWWQGKENIIMVPALIYIPSATAGANNHKDWEIVGFWSTNTAGTWEIIGIELTWKNSCWLFVVHRNSRASTFCWEHTERSVAHSHRQHSTRFYSHTESYSLSVFKLQVVGNKLIVCVQSANKLVSIHHCLCNYGFNLSAESTAICFSILSG